LDSTFFSLGLHIFFVLDSTFWLDSTLKIDPGVVTTVLVGIFYRKHIDAIMNIFLVLPRLLGDIFDLPVTRGTFVTVFMDTGDTFDHWLHGNTGDSCHGYGGTVVTVVMDRGNTCGCCHGCVETFVTVAMDMGDNCDCCHEYREHLWLLPWIHENIWDCCHGYGGTL